MQLSISFSFMFRYEITKVCGEEGEAHLCIVTKGKI